MARNKKTAVVTGASGMIGSCVAKRLAQDGWRLHLIDIDAARLAALAAELPGDTTFHESRLQTPSDCADAVSGAGAHIDGLVHLAGIFVSHDLTPESRDTYDATLQNNATNAYDLVTAALPGMSSGSSFVFTSSLGFNRGNIDQVAYSMAKGAIVGLTRALSRQAWSGRHSCQCHRARHHRKRDDRPHRRSPRQGGASGPDPAWALRPAGRDGRRRVFSVVR